MIDFLIKSSISLLTLFIFYNLVLEKEKTHFFNRYYLLLSILFSILIPFFKFEIVKEIPAKIIVEELQTSTVTILKEKINYTSLFIWTLYSIITTVFFIRYIKNIKDLISIKNNNTNLKFKSATLILIPEKKPPFTFLNSIYINQEDHINKKIEDELYTHELVHVTQKHSLDVLFIELLMTIFWFNPIFILYKKAIQLNHEFLADEEIVKTYKNVLFYQNLLIQKNNGNQTIYLASNLNYLVTKKRLIMMTKKPTKYIAIYKKIALAPVLAVLVFFLCVETVAQEIKQKTPTKNKIISQKNDSNKEIKIKSPEKTICTEVVTEKDTTILDFNEITEQPTFNGGIQAFYNYIGKNFKIPDVEKLDGKIIVSFIIEKDGSISEVKVLRDIGYGTGEEAIRVLTDSPKWNPGTKEGKPVRVLYTLPISIKTQ